MPEIVERPVDPQTVARLTAAGCDPRLARIYAARGLASLDELAIRVAPSTHPKCVRCWQHRGDVGAVEAHPQLCGRCVSNIEGPGETRMFF